ncbi:GM21647 [Drosophila sechellia]|uniref:GM21647 n=1 Tax=Drosophila sechellia TaxID=7238 RepID=B4IJX3_DROSE|nr:GM21647 [Drosophila sechellia]
MPPGVAQAGQSSYGSDQNIPYKPVNTKGNTLTSSIIYSQNQGRDPHPSSCSYHCQASANQGAASSNRSPQVYVKHHPRRFRFEPVFVNVVKPPAEKYFVNENKQGYGQGSQSHGHGHGHGGHGHGHSGHGHGGHGAGPHGPGPHDGGRGLPAYASGADSAAASAGYQLLQSGNQGLSALANIAGEREGPYGPAPSHQHYSAGPAGHGGYAAPAY